MRPLPHNAPLLTIFTHSVSTTIHPVYPKLIHNFGNF
jgi:hypothetical protein